MEEIVTTYDNEKRYVFSNWSNEDFTCAWGGVSTTIKVGETVELPQYKAYTFTRHFVNREMSKANQDIALDVPEARKPFEMKTIAEITAGTDSPALATLKEKIKEEIAVESGKKAKKAAKEVKAEKEETTEEFADIK